jgi:protein-L-isoaspartate(D-aspartate) O-methyltransferase
MGAADSPTPCRWRTKGATLFWLAAAVIGGAIMVSWSNVHDFFDSEPPPDDARDEPSDHGEDAAITAARRQMVDDQLRSRDIVEPRVLEVMGRVARERFVPPAQRRHAYEDHPLPIGLDQTISQPYIVALMTQLADPKPNDRVLEIGIGSGYQAAVLAELCKEVYGVEILEPLATVASQRLANLGYKNITVRCGDGYQGWAEHAPFDAILVTAAPDHIPQPLLDQLAPGGRLVIPVGVYYQDLLLIQKRSDGTLRRRNVAPVRFVPMTGQSEKAGPRGSDP